MARIRTIKPALWASEKLGRLPVLSRLTFVGLISQADDAGRGRGAARFLMGALHAYAPDVTEEGLAKATTDLHQAGLAIFYEIDGCRYYALPNWDAHQRIDKPGPSEIPPPPQAQPDLFGEHSANDRRTGGEDSALEGKGRGVGMEGTTELAPSPSDSAQALMTFPVVGRGEKTWKLTQLHVDALRTDFPNLDVLAELRKAHAWAVANPGKRKTQRGMAAFLVRWMTRVTDGGNGGGFSRAARPAGGAAPQPGKYQGVR